MDWQLTLQQLLFLIAVPVFGLIGFRRGWRREIISLLFIIVAFIFLALRGGLIVAKLLYQVLLSQTLTDTNLLTKHAHFVDLATGFTLIVIILLGYVIGSRLYSKPGLAQDRILGIIPGIISGIVLVAYLTPYFLSNTQEVIGRGSILLPLNISTDFPTLIFVIAVIVVIIGLLAVRTKRSK